MLIKNLPMTLIFSLFAIMMSANVAMADDVVDHAPFDKILKKYVNSKGMVNYGKLKANKEDSRALYNYIEDIAHTSPTKDHSKRAKLAFYINAYNANVISKVIANYPTKSVMKVDKFFKQNNISVSEKKTSLDALENEIIRPKFKDAGIHFVLVCAAQSCPPLQRKAITEKNVSSTMKKTAKAFITKNTTVGKDGKVTTSKLFDWFKDDFKRDKGSVQGYLSHYYAGDNAELLKSKDVKITFSEYNWDLNKQ